MRSKTIVIASVLLAQPDTVWELLTRVDTLRYIASPYASFTPADEQSAKAQWREGSAARYRLRIGLLPLGIHTIRVGQFDRANYLVQTQEGNRMVPVWNHAIRLEPVQGGTRYTDEVEIGAGLITDIVALWSKAFYRHRQRRWVRLLQESKKTPEKA